MSKLKIFIPISLSFFLVSSVYAGSFRKDNQFWDIRIFQTKNPLDADIVVYKANHIEEAEQKDYIWKWSAFGTTAVKFVDEINDAELVIYITKDKNKARWLKRHPLKGKLVN